jgi:N4-gp56 family major capsid protein
MALQPNLTSTTGLNDASAIFYDRTLLEFLQFPLFFQESAEKRPMPGKNGTQIQFLRPVTLSVATTPITEGTNPSGALWNTTKIMATPLQYGNYVAFSDRLVLEAYDNITEAIHEVLGYNAGLTFDTLQRNQMAGNMTTYYTGGAVSEITTATACAAVDFRKAAKTLQTLAVLPFEDGCMHGLLHPATAADLQADSSAGGWLDVNKYISIEKNHAAMLRGEVGKMFNIRFQVTPNASTGVGASSAVTYHNWVIGKQAVGSVDVANEGVEKIVHMPGDAGVADPLNLTGSIGYKFYAVFPVLDSNRAIEVIGTSAY